MNREYLKYVGSKDYNRETGRVELNPILSNYSETNPSNKFLITNRLSIPRNINLSSLNDYFYYSNGWLNAEHINVPLSNLVKINILSLYPKLILSFYDIGLFQLINKEDIERIRNFYKNRSELKLDSNKYYEEKIWLNSFLFSHVASHDFKYVIDAYMYGFIMDLIDKTKGKVVFYNVDEIVMLENEFNFESFLEPLFDYEVERFDRGYFKDIRNYALIGEYNISVGDESLVDLIKNSDMISGKDKRLANFTEKGVITEENKNISEYVDYNQEVLTYYFETNPNGIDNPNFNISKLESKYLITIFIKMLFDMGIQEKEEWSLLINKLSHLLNTIKIEVVSTESALGEIQSMFNRTVSITPEEHFKDYFYNVFNFVEFVEKIIK